VVYRLRALRFRRGMRSKVPGIPIADEIVDVGHIRGKRPSFFSSSLVNGVPTLTIEPTSVPSSGSVAYSRRGFLLDAI
jgi:hypothetical protein